MSKHYSGEKCTKPGLFRMFSDSTGMPFDRVCTIDAADKIFPPTENNCCWRDVDDFVPLWVLVVGGESTLLDFEQKMLALEGGRAYFEREAGGARVRTPDGFYRMTAYENEEFTRYALFKRGYTYRTTETGRPASLLRKEIERAINRCSAENGSNTPDFILADYLTNCLDAFDRASRAREEWFGKKHGIAPSSAAS